MLIVCFHVLVVKEMYKLGWIILMLNHLIESQEVYLS